MKKYNAASIAKPVGAYSHAIETPPNARTLYVSGQIGIDPAGILGRDVKEQATILWSNIVHILEDAGMDLSNVIKVTAYLTDPNDMASYGEVRTSVLGASRPCSTLIFVSALARPEWKVEVEIIAAKVG